MYNQQRDVVVRSILIAELEDAEGDSFLVVHAIRGAARGRHCVMALPLWSKIELCTKQTIA